ncbi:MAG: transglutaminase-like domain-containing protein [Ignisphaera sp.]
MRLALYALIAVTIVLGGVSAKLYLDYNALSTSYDTLTRSYQLLQQDYESVRNAHQVLKSQYDTLLKNHVELENSFRELQTQYTALQGSYTELENIYRQVKADYEELENRYRGLQSQYSTLERDYAELKNSYNQLKLDYEAISSAYQKIQEQYRDLSERFSYLEKTYSNLQQEYNNLRSQFNTLQLEYARLTELSLRLNSSLSEIITTLTRYCCIPYAFERVLNLDEVKAVEQYVLSAKVDPNNVPLSIQNIYRWIRSNVKYVHDVPLPIPTQVACDPKTQLCYYSRFTDLQNYVQTPSFTAKYGQGDCDDQAVLAYAMIKYYFIFVHGKEYDLLIARIEMGDGSGHLAVFLPVQGGKLTIIDPAGSYLTSTLLGSITHRSAYEELMRYSNHWSSHGGVKKIDLYRVDVRTGRYYLVVSGDINTVAIYLSLS